MIFKLAPSRENYYQINNWLKTEFSDCNEGFFANIHIIGEAFDSNEFIIVEVEEVAVAFVVYTLRDYTAKIDIISVSPRTRSEGIGKFIFQEFRKMVIEKGLVLINLECSPLSSNSYWRKFGFIDLPWSSVGLREYLYMNVVPNQISKNSISQNMIELWYKEQEGRDDNTDPNIIWHLPLEHPIIHPCMPDWRIRLTIDGKVVCDDKEKYFNSSIVKDDYYLLIPKETYFV